LYLVEYLVSDNVKVAAIFLDLDALIVESKQGDSKL